MNRRRRYPPRRHFHADLAGALFCGALAVVSSACHGPIAPHPVAPEVIGLEIACPTSLLVGQSSFCFALAHYSDGSSQNDAQAVWLSNDPNIASFTTLGRIFGRGAGQATITAQYEGRSASVPISVRAENFVKITGEGVQGLFQVGRTITMFTVGEYGVASAESATLGIEITDQEGKLIVASAPKTVLRGGDSFSFSTTFTISTGTTKVCRSAVLQIGENRLIDTGSTGLLSCVNVVQ